MSVKLALCPWTECRSLELTCNQALPSIIIIGCNVIFFILEAQRRHLNSNYEANFDLNRIIN